ncbi:MAG: hypothetical protein J0L83_14485 [Chitinophagales bacterium]|nr:hypothetical protein [Chitinophagales bacterium]
MPAAKKFNKRLPKNWRQRVSEILANQGIELTSQQVYDVLRERKNDLKILRKTVSARNKVAKEFEALQRKKQQAIKK